MEATTSKKCSHGLNVRRWREWQNMNQDVLAELIGVSQTTMSAYEKKDKLEPEILQKIAVALGIPVEAITQINNESPVNIFSGTWNDNATAIDAENYQHYQPTFNPLDKVVELYNEKNALYERMLKEKDSVIELLQSIVKEKK